MNPTTKKKIAAIVIVLAILCLLWRHSDFFSNEMQMPELEAELQDYHGDYLIVFTEVKPDPVSISYTRFRLTDEAGKTILEGNLTDVYEKDTGFLDENFEPVNINILFYSVDDYILIRANDSILIKSGKNGGIGEANMTFRLLLLDQDPNTRDTFWNTFFKIKLKDNIPVCTDPPKVRENPTQFKIDNSTIPENSTISISTEHNAIDSFYQFPGRVAKIGVTLINNATSPADNITVRFLSESAKYNGPMVLIKEITNISLNGTFMKRILITHTFPIDFEDKKYYHIYVEVQRTGWKQPLTASTRIFLFPVVLS